MVDVQKKAEKKKTKAGGKENSKKEKKVKPTEVEKILSPEEQAIFDAEAARKSEEFVKELDKELQGKIAEV